MSKLTEIDLLFVKIALNITNLDSARTMGRHFGKGGFSGRSTLKLRGPSQEQFHGSEEMDQNRKRKLLMHFSRSRDHFHESSVSRWC